MDDGLGDVEAKADGVGSGTVEKDGLGDTTPGFWMLDDDFFLGRFFGGNSIICILFGVRLINKTSNRSKAIINAGKPYRPSGIADNVNPKKL